MRIWKDVPWLEQKFLNWSTEDLSKEISLKVKITLINIHSLQKCAIYIPGLSQIISVFSPSFTSFFERKPHWYFS